MLEEVTPLAVVATGRYLDLLTIHVILNLMVPHSLSVRMVPVDSLQKTHARPSNEACREINQHQGFKRASVDFCLLRNKASRVKATDAT